MSDLMTFPETWEEFEKSYGFADSEEVYTNGSRLIPSFRVKQWLDHEESKRESKQQATDSSDCIYRKDAIDAVNAYLGLSAVSRTIQNMTSIQEILENLPSAEPEHLVKESGDLVKDLVNDCISRQDAVKTMYDACQDIDDESLHIDVIVDILENLPPESPDLSDCSDKL